MQRSTLHLLGLAGLAALVTAAPAQKPNAKADSAAWRPQDGEQLPLWPGAVPDMAGVRQPPERVEVEGGRNGELPVTLVHDVTSPTITIMRPKSRNSGAAVVVFPGGGFQLLAIDGEGTEPCDWATARGMTCAVVKYRVPNSDTHGDPNTGKQVSPKVLRALQDAQRAIRILRSRAAELGVDPGHIGVMGFSAGGYLVAQTSNIFTPAYRPVDAIDRVSSRPDFAIAAYPGHLCRDGTTLDPTIRPTKQTPPTFIVQNWDDPVDDVCNSMLYARALELADVAVEMHLFAKGGHAFALRKIGHPVEQWPGLLEGWLKDTGVLR